MLVVICGRKPGGLVVRSLRRNPGRVGWCRRGAEESEEVSELGAELAGEEENTQCEKGRVRAPPITGKNGCIRNAKA